MLERYLIIWLTLSSLAAYYWPVWVVRFGSWWSDPAHDPFLATKPLMWGLIAAIMVAVGYMLPRDEVRELRSRWPAVLGGTLVQYTSMPLLAWLASRVFALDAASTIGIIIVGCVPGAMASNVLTLNARGNASYSVSLTTSSTLLSPLAVPVTLWLALGKLAPNDPRGVILNLLATVVAPVIAGYLLQQWIGGSAAGRRIASTVANLVILWVIAAVVGINRDKLAASTLGLLAPLLAVNLAGYAAGYGAAAAMRLPEPMRRALTLEIGMQNAGLGTVLALKMFPDQPQIAILPAAYTFGCMLTGTLLARFWAWSSEYAATTTLPTEKVE